MYLPFVNERLLKGKADFFDALRKVNLAIGLKIIKDSEDSFSNEKERGEFRVMLWEVLNPSLLHQCH